jgi:hypothetical protein
MPRTPNELIELASKFHDECLGAAELARLNELLRDEDARREFLELSEVHVALKQNALPADDYQFAAAIDAVHRKIVPDAALRPGLSGGASCLLAEPEERPQASRSSSGYLSVGLAVATALLLGAFSAWQFWGPNDAGIPTTATRSPAQTPTREPAPPPREEAHQPEYVARIVAASRSVVWASTGAPADFLMRLSPGERLKLDAGLLQIEFAGGAQVILSGPAELEILGAQSARLAAGALTGRSEVGEFTLHTPKAEVVDIGTEFGVSVGTTAATRVAVFEGEVHVKSATANAHGAPLYRLTKGMAVRIDERGVVESTPGADDDDFQRRLPSAKPTNLGAGELSLIDVICGSPDGEYRIAGAIDPLSGHWGDGPWNQPQGVEVRAGDGRFVSLNWNSMVDGVFIPPSAGEPCQVDSVGARQNLPECSGATWGPIWARRRIGADLDPFAHRLDQDAEGFWGAGTITAMLDRLRWARDGLVGLHANVGVTIDLDAIRRERAVSISRLRGVVTLLERSHVSQPFHPKSLADFRVYVDGEERHQRLAFSREDGDAQFGAAIKDSDRFLTLVVTDAGDGNLFDRVILIDPVLELTLE